MAFGLFRKKRKENLDSRYFTLKIKDIVQVGKDAVNLVFETPGPEFHYEPGQFITIVAEIGGKFVRRAYSLCTTPFQDKYPAVTVKRVEGGLMSNYINDHFKAGDMVKVMEPMGTFTTEFTLTSKRDAVFIGGGSGITPLISIIRSALAKEPKSRLTLIYGNRSPEYIIFRDSLKKLQEENPDRFQVIHILEEDPIGMAKYTGRPTAEMIGFICDQLNISMETQFFICGPDPMMKVAVDGLIQIGVDPEQIKKESFDPKKGAGVESIEEHLANTGVKSEVTVILDGEEHVITVESGKTILEAGLSQSLDMPFSCQSGLCTACRGKCLEGEISLDDVEGLSQDEIEEGYRLLCVGKPKTPKVRVEIG